MDLLRLCRSRFLRSIKVLYSLQNNWETVKNIIFSLFFQYLASMYLLRFICFDSMYLLSFSLHLGLKRWKRTVNQRIDIFNLKFDCTSEALKILKSLKIEIDINNIILFYRKLTKMIKNPIVLVLKPNV